MSIDQGVRGLWQTKIGGFPLTLIVALTTLLRTNVLHCNANCLGLVAQSSGAQKIIRPNVFRPTGFSPNRLHPDKFSLKLSIIRRKVP